MVYLKSRMIYLIACQLTNLLGFSPTLISGEATARQNAIYISENNCDKLSDDSIAAPILYEASDVILLGKANEKSETYGPKNAQYSMKVTPHCLMRGNTSENEVVVRNLGQTKCGASNVELSGNYLFFLLRTSDPKVYEALTLGAKPVRGSVLLNEAFTLYCSIKRVAKCKAGKCPMACNYSLPEIGGCINTELVINEMFNVLYPDRIQATTTTTQKRKDMTEKSTTMTPDMNKNISAEANVEAKGNTVTSAPENKVTLKVEGVRGRTGQAGLTTNVFLILSTVSIVRLLSLSC